MLSFLYVYSDHSILECYNLFSGVELSMRSCFVIYCWRKINLVDFEKIFHLHTLPGVPTMFITLTLYFEAVTTMMLAILGFLVSPDLHN